SGIRQRGTASLPGPGRGSPARAGSPSAADRRTYRVGATAGVTAARDAAPAYFAATGPPNTRLKSLLRPKRVSSKAWRYVTRYPPRTRNTGAERSGNRSTGSQRAPGGSGTYLGDPRRVLVSRRNQSADPPAPGSGRQYFVHACGRMFPGEFPGPGTRLLAHDGAGGRIVEQFADNGRQLVRIVGKQSGHPVDNGIGEAPRGAITDGGYPVLRGFD